MATINDVARLARVSKSTVSNVVTKRKYVSAELAKKVIEACEELNYVPSFMAMTMVTKKTHIIGLFLDVEDFYDDFYGDLIKGVFLRAQQYSYKILLYGSQKADDLRRSFLVNKEPIDGAILLKPFENDFRMELVDNLPFVLIGNNDNENTYMVDVDNKKIAYDITQKLIDFGHRSFLFVTSDLRFTVSNDRISGFKKALQDNNIIIRNSKIVMTDHEGRDISEFLENNIKECEKHTVIIVPSDIVGEKVYHFFEQQGKIIGRDISIAALGGNSVANQLSPPLTTVWVDYTTIGEKCVDCVYQQLSGATIPQKRQTVDCSITYTDSCGLKINT